ncbi:protein quaking-A [Alosa sapidissima]|uniref:protein quaking-A n=1 Tax=Alosa sapidissima TaxID=34773 RepID=UPI001C091DD1|nr:protein quaking-A [Alosa sapidissima]
MDDDITVPRGRRCADAPQGCALSPLLYVIHTHDCTASSSSTSIKFADDAVVLGPNSENNEQGYLNQVEDLALWCQTNNLAINASQTKEMVLDFNRKQGTVENIFTGCISAWYGNCTVRDQDALQRVVRTAERTIRASLPTLKDTYSKRYNFVGRILGPRGLTAKQLEAETGCKIMVRGKSSMRDKKKEEQNRGKPNWEHLNEDLHVLITVEDTQTRAEIKMRRAVEEVKKLLVPAAEGEDNLKKMQLMELAILNGTYRDTNIKTPPLAFSLAAAAAAAQGPRLIAAPPGQVLPPSALRPPPSPAGAPPIMNLIRPTQMTAAMLPNGTPTLVPPGPDAGIIYTTSPYDYPYTLAPTSLLEYPMEPGGMLGKRPWGLGFGFGAPGAYPAHQQDGGLLYTGGAGLLDVAGVSAQQEALKGAMATKVRRHDTRVHPYQRIVTADRAHVTLEILGHPTLSAEVVTGQLQSCYLLSAKTLQAALYISG